MPEMHDAAVREGLKSRLKSLKPDAKRKWGKMSADQMLWHVASSLELALGRASAPPAKAPVPLPKPVLRFAVVNLPWPRGAPTIPQIVASGQHDFEKERKRILGLIDELAKKDLSGPWPVHAVLGEMSGLQYTRLQAKHLDHHLKQFGA